jgi:hypothetical protein
MNELTLLLDSGDYPGYRLLQEALSRFMTFLIQGAGRSCSAVILIWAAIMIFAGCQTPGIYRVDVDEKALDIIAETDCHLWITGRNPVFQNH